VDPDGLWLPVLLWAALIFAISHIPHLRSPLGSFSLRKGAHIVEYAVLAGPAGRGFDGAGCEWMGALYAFAAAVAFGASDELHQVFVPGRHGTLSDLRYGRRRGADGAHILLGGKGGAWEDDWDNTFFGALRPFLESSRHAASLVRTSWSRSGRAAAP